MSDPRSRPVPDPMTDAEREARENVHRWRFKANDVLFVSALDAYIAAVRAAERERCEQLRARDSEIREAGNADAVKRAVAIEQAKLKASERARLKAERDARALRRILDEGLAVIDKAATTIRNEAVARCIAVVEAWYRDARAYAVTSEEMAMLNSCESNTLAALRGITEEAPGGR